MADTGNGPQIFSWQELQVYVADVIAMYEATDKEHKALSSIRALKSDIQALNASAVTDARKLISGMFFK